MTHPALTVLAALCAGQTITEPSGRRVCLGYDTENDNRRVLAVIAHRERPGQPPDTVLLPLDVTVTDFIAWATGLPAAAIPTSVPPVDADPLHIGDVGLADIQDELPDLTIPQIQALLDEYREDIEEQLGAECRRLLREFAAEMDWKRRYVYLS